jgi:hypothetical protein
MSTSRRGRKSKSAGRGQGKKAKRRGRPFRKGFDPRRHIFTQQDCWLGYAVCWIKHPHLRDWLKMRVRMYYAERERREALDIRTLASGPEGSLPDTSFTDEAIPF